MFLIFTFLLVSGLESAYANDEPISDPPPAEAEKLYAFVQKK